MLPFPNHYEQVVLSGLWAITLVSDKLLNEGGRKSRCYRIDSRAQELRFS